MLRDYHLELRRENVDTTIKIEVERDSNTDLNKRVFKRIYICLGPLKKGFKVYGRDLLGLDGAFMKGPYPGQLLTVVDLDGCAAAITIPYFDRAMEELKEFNKEAFEWLAKIPAHSRAKLDILLNNLCECFNDGPLTPSVTKLLKVAMDKASKYTVRKWELTCIPCAHAIATNYNMALNGIQVGIPEEWVHKCYWLATWKHAYSYTLRCLNGKVMWKKS
ncbi:hypothetical protein Tco_0582684 [Tanacetum coccineum]